jgi:hypothetical protein
METTPELPEKETPRRTRTTDAGSSKLGVPSVPSPLFSQLPAEDAQSGARPSIESLKKAYAERFGALPPDSFLAITAEVQVSVKTPVQPVSFSGKFEPNVTTVQAQPPHHTPTQQLEVLRTLPPPTFPRPFFPLKAEPPCRACGEARRGAVVRCRNPKCGAWLSEPSRMYCHRCGGEASCSATECPNPACHASFTIRVPTSDLDLGYVKTESSIEYELRREFESLVSGDRDWPREAPGSNKNKYQIMAQCSRFNCDWIRLKEIEDLWEKGKKNMALSLFQPIFDANTRRRCAQSVMQDAMRGLLFLVIWSGAQFFWPVVFWLVMRTEHESFWHWFVRVAIERPDLKGVIWALWTALSSLVIAFLALLSLFRSR